MALRRPWVAFGISTAVLVAAAFAVSPLRDAATFQDASDLRLVRPLAYVAMAPVSDVLDTLTLLSARQHVALVLGLAGLCLLTRRRTGLVVLAAVMAAEAGAALLLRPMASLESTDPDLVRIDFHSHTNASRDARAGFTLERNHAWHRTAGYDVAVVTDHRVETPVPRNLTDPVMLPGIEVPRDGEHFGRLGALVVWNHPHDLRSGTAAVQAVEISNGAPHAMDLVRRKRHALVALARERDLPLTGGSDNHGWGATAPNWTLVRIAGWRALDADQLEQRIARVLSGGFAATRVIERNTADPGASTVALAATVLVVPWRMLTTLTMEERASWLFWTWMVTGALRLARRPDSIVSPATSGIEAPRTP